MTSPIGINRARSVERNVGFTLIELLLVMAMLSIVLAVAAPTLSRFFRGRSLESEARRFLALTRYASARAISEGLPMVLWLDQVEGAYYVSELNGFTRGNANDGLVQRPLLTATRATPPLRDETGETRTFRLAEKLQFELPVEARARGQLTAIHFSPDGVIEADSPRTIVIRQDERQWLAIVRATNGLAYEISQYTNAEPTFYR